MLIKKLGYFAFGLILIPFVGRAAPITLNFSGQIYDSSDSSWIGHVFTGTVIFDPINPGGTPPPAFRSSPNSISLHSIGMSANDSIQGTPWIQSTLNLPGQEVFRTLPSFTSTNQGVTLINPKGTQQFYIHDFTNSLTYPRQRPSPYSIYQTYFFDLSAVYFPDVNIGSPFANGLDLSSINLANATGGGNINLYQINVGNINYRHVSARYRLTALNAVPEPYTVTLVGIGLIGVAMCRRRSPI